MIGRVLVVLLALLTAALIQTAFLPYLALGGFRPDLLLLVTVGFALRDGPASGVRVGFAAGIVNDLLLQQSAVGLSALVYVGVGYTVGTVRPYLAPESVTAPLMLSFMSGLIGTAGYGVLSRLLGDERFTVDLVVSASLFVAFFNTLLAPVVVGVIKRLDQRFPIERAGLAR